MRSCSVGVMCRVSNTCIPLAFDSMHKSVDVILMIQCALLCIDSKLHVKWCSSLLLNVKCASLLLNVKWCASLLLICYEWLNIDMCELFLCVNCSTFLLTLVFSKQLKSSKLPKLNK